MFKVLASVKVRLFIITWMIFTIHFATNVVREHYPAFSIVEGNGFKVDRYLGFHPDIFRHSDGHSYVGNNVAIAVMAALPLFVFDPVLDWLENHRKEQLTEQVASTESVYRTKYPNRREFLQKVKEQGLDLRFGAATVITSAFFMAPFTALSVLLMFHILLLRGVGQGRALGLTFLFGFGTPVFFRTLNLNHNIFLMHATFLAFYLLWNIPSQNFPSQKKRFWAGFLGGFCIAVDYSGVICLLSLYAYLLILGAQKNGFGVRGILQNVKESLPFILGSITPVLYLLYTQWAMFGNPFLPGQYWMPMDMYTDRGWRGFSFPALDLYWKNLFDPAYGMFLFGPLLLIGCIPVFLAKGKMILPGKERWFTWLLFWSFLTFCAANQYSRMQFNSGFRYLIPLVPFLFLAASDHLVKIKSRTLWVLSIPFVLHSWVLATVREPVFASWRLFLENGIHIPWLTVLQKTTPLSNQLIHSWLVPVVIYLFAGSIGALIWWLGYKQQMTEKI